jgi:hypothetical protein
MVPRQFQILWVNSVAFAWTIILTFISHSSEAAEKEKASGPSAKRASKKDANQ